MNDQQSAEVEAARWLAWSGGQYPDDSRGEVISADADGTIVLDDGITTWNPLRAAAFLAQRIETLMRELDEEQRLVEKAWAERDRETEAAKRAEAQRDRLAEALREQRRRWNEAATHLTMDGLRSLDRRADNAVGLIDAALSEIEQAASNEVV